MKHYEIVITPKQRANLIKLADYLATGETRMVFDMLSYCNNDAWGSLDPKEHHCGTVGCAVGHGPAAGIRLRGDYSWNDYCDRVFGTNAAGASVAYEPSPVGGMLFNWLFQSTWTKVDNTPQGAAKRIYYTLRHGIPENHMEQMKGLAPLCYKRTRRVAY